MTNRTNVNVVAVSTIDAEGFRSSTGIGATWEELDQDPRAKKLRVPASFQTPFPGFRRLDELSKALLIAIETLHLERHLSESERRDTALIFGSATGCLDADLRFAASLDRPMGIEPAVFPYTLPSTCLGEIAIRHKLQGPTLSVSLADDQPGAALDAASQLLDAGTRSALVAFGDWVPRDPTGSDLRLGAILMIAGEDSSTQTSFIPGEDIWASVADATRRGQGANRSG